MSTLILLNSPQPPATAKANVAGAAAPAQDAASTGESMADFAELLDSGIERLAPPAVMPDTDLPASLDDADDAQACDPAALLQAIAAGQTNVDTRHAVTAQPAPGIAVPPTVIAVETDTLQPAAPASARAAAATASKFQGTTRRVDGQTQPATPEHDLPLTVTGRDAQRKEPVISGAAATPPPVAGANLLAAVKADAPAAGEPARPAQASFTFNANAPLPGAAHLQAAAPAAIAAHVEVLAQPFGTPAWDDGLSTRVVWMARHDVQSAQIRLNPEDLGPIEIKLTLTNDPGSTNSSAAVQFSALHAATREAIESALPRLREMLEANGIALGQTSVDAGTAGNGQAFADPGRQFAGMARTAPELPPGRLTEPSAGPHPRRGNGLVDTFA